MLTCYGRGNKLAKQCRVRDSAKVHLSEPVGRKFIAPTSGEKKKILSRDGVWTAEAEGEKKLLAQKSDRLREEAIPPLGPITKTFFLKKFEKQKPRRMADEQSCSGFSFWTEMTRIYFCVGKAVLPFRTACARRQA